MRLVATGLLIAMSLVYVLLTLTRAEGGWSYARAFAEAAMVGALADWFAVTALFRHPLGLPIPHTAIIPRSKQRIADALSEFVAVNFLAADVVRDRLADLDLALSLARQLADPATARRIADGLVDAAPAVSDLLEDEVVSEFLRRQIEQGLAHPSFPAALGRGLKVLTENGRHQRILDAALTEGFRALEQHEKAIRARVRDREDAIGSKLARKTFEPPNPPRRDDARSALRKAARNRLANPRARAGRQHVPWTSKGARIHLRAPLLIGSMNF